MAKQIELFDKERYGIEQVPDIKADLIVVPVSGGKDSQACLKLAIATGKRVVGMFNDTHWEHPDTYKHIDHLREIYGIEINRVTDGASVPEQVLRFNRFPSMQTRFCTKHLKIRPGKRWIEEFSEKNGPLEVWWGVRKDESVARKKRYLGLVGDELVDPNLYMSDYPKRMAKNGIMFRLPIIDWSESDVFEYLAGEEHPHYEKGRKRVGCFPCLALGDKEIEAAFNFDDFGNAQRHAVRLLEKETGKSALRGDVGGNGCSICSI